jgi:hypothetical protein
MQKINREDVRDALVAFMERHGLKTGKAASVALGTIGEHTVTRIVNRSERSMGNHQLAKVLRAIDAYQAAPLAANPVQPEPLLPVARSTDVITARRVDGRGDVFTFQDIADGFKCPLETVKSAFYRNEDSWLSGETFQFQIETAAGARTVTGFPAEGVLNFCRFVKNERTDLMWRHIRDHWIASQAPQQQTAPEVDRVMAQIMAAFAGQMGAQFNAVQVELAQIKETAEQAKQTADTVGATAERAAEAALTRKQKAIDALALAVEKYVSLLIRTGCYANTKKGRGIAYSTVNDGIRGRYKVQNRQGLSAEQAEDATQFIRSEYHRTIGGAGQRIIDFPSA